MKEKSQRQFRVENLIRQEVSSFIIRDVNCYLPYPISITAVDVSKDIRYATVFYSCMGDEQALKHTQDILNKSTHLLNKSLGKAIHTKYTPKLRFKYDESGEYAHDINKIINEKIRYSSEQE